MTNEIVKHSEMNLDELQRMASMLAQSGYFEADRDRTTAIAQMATKILAGRELGYGPFAAVQGIHVIKGKPALSANLMAAAVKAHPRYDYKVRKMENDEVIIEFFENKESIGLSSFTTKDANAAGTQNLSKFARNMLFARAMSNGVRWYCPDVFYGSAVYTPEELGATVDGEGNVTSPAYTVVNKTTGEVTRLETVIEPEPEPDPVVKLAEQAMAGEGMADNPFDGGKSPAFKRFHAEGTKTFGKQWDDARHWLIERYTKAMTPDKVRKSSGDMSDDELDVITDGLVEKRAYYQKEFGKAAGVATGK